MIVLSILSLTVSVIGLTVTYVAMREHSARMDAGIWNVKFTNLTAKARGKATYVLPVISDTSLSDSKVLLSGVGDSVAFTFDVENIGSLDAILGTVLKGNLKCSGVGEKAKEDAAYVCSHIDYSLQYEDGTPVASNDLLNKDSHRTLRLILKSKVAPSNPVTVSGFQVAMFYHQN